MDEKQNVFEQLSLSDFRIRSSSTRKTLSNNYRKMIANSNDNIRI